MTDYFAAAAPLGRPLILRSAERPGARSVRGFVQPLSPRDASEQGRPARPGRPDRREYLLLVPAAALEAGETDVIVSDGERVYELLRAEPVYADGTTGHWEGVLRLKGGTGNA